MDKKIDLFIKSYRGDFWLLYLALATIKKNVTGYNNIILLIPEKDKELFDTRDLPERTLIHYVEDEDALGWLRQQVFKLKAHEYSFADYIMFSDSDCLFDHPVNLQDAIKDDKPEILFTDWSLVGDAIVWKEPTERILNDKVEWEFMRRNQLCYHRETLVKLNEQNPDLENIIMSSRRFSEFNLIGAWAYKFEREKYKWTNTAEWTYVEPMAIQCWSHSSKAEGVSETHLREHIRTLETILKAFGLPVPQ